jgi:hypothetical protein
MPLQDFKVLEVLGKGSYASVYKVRLLHPILERR